MKAGDKLYNGYIVSQYEADIYNEMTDRIERYKKAGLSTEVLEENRNFFFKCLY